MPPKFMVRVRKVELPFTKMQNVAGRESDKIESYFEHRTFDDRLMRQSSVHISSRQRQAFDVKAGGRSQLGILTWESSAYRRHLKT